MIIINYEEIKERLKTAQKAGLLTKIHKMDKESIFEQVKYCTEILLDINDISKINICSLSYTILMIMHDLEISALKNPNEKTTKIGTFLRKSHQIILKYEKEVLQNNVMQSGKENIEYISKEKMLKEQEVKKEQTIKEEREKLPKRSQMIKEQEEQLLIALKEFENELRHRRKTLKMITAKKRKQLKELISYNYKLNGLLNSLSSRLVSIKEEKSALLKSMTKVGMDLYDYIEEYASSINELNKEFSVVKQEYDLYKKETLNMIKAMNPFTKKQGAKSIKKMPKNEEKQKPANITKSRQEINLCLQKSQTTCGRIVTDIIDLEYLLEEYKKLDVTNKKQVLWIQKIMQNNFHKLQKKFKEVSKEFQENLTLAKKYGIDIKTIEKDRNRIMTSAEKRLLKIEKALKNDVQKEKTYHLGQEQASYPVQIKEPFEVTKQEEVTQPKEMIKLTEQEETKEKLLQQKSYLASLKKLAPWALSGAALGLSASLIFPSVGLTGVGVLRLSYTGVKMVNKVISKKFLHAPTIIDQAIDMTKESVKKKYGTTKIYQKIAELNQWLRQPEIQWFLTGISFGYVLGNALDLHERFLEKPQASGVTTNLQEQITTETEKVMSNNQVVEPTIEQPTIPQTNILPDYHWLNTGETLDLSGVKQGFTNAMDAITNNNSTSVLSNLASQENGAFINNLYLSDGTVYTGNIGDLLNTGIDPSTIAARIKNQNGDFAYFNLKSILQTTKELVRTR